jgi:small-conductance mechanosensitive channel
MINISRKFNVINLVSLLVVFAMLCPAYSWAQAENIKTPGEGLEIPEGISETKFLYSGPILSAPVVVNGEVLFHLAGVSSFPAKERAKLIARRIEALAEDAKFDPGMLRVEEGEGRYGIYTRTGGKHLLVIIPEDAAIEGANIHVIADIFKAKIKNVITAYRYDRQPDVLRANIYSALLRTFGLAITLILANWLFRKLDMWLEKRVKYRIQELEAKSLRIIQAEQIWHVFRIGLRLLRVLIVLLIAWVFLHFVLNLFPWTRYFSNTAFDHVINPLRNMGLAVIGYIPSLIFLILLYFVTRYVLKLIYQYFAAVQRGRIKLNSFDADWSLPTYRIVRVVVILLAVVLAYPYIPGSDSQAFKGISIIFGVLFSLGSTSVISNVIAGYTMTYRRAFRVGDRVKIGDTIGDVLEMRVLVTHVRSLKNEEVVIPNSTILNNEVINYSKLASEQGLILHTTVGIGYEVAWRQVEAMLLMAADRTEGIAKDPKPFVLQTALADFAVNYELNAYCKDEKQAMALYSELHRNIQDIFNEFEVSIMTPAYEADTPEPKVVPKDQWYAVPATKNKD